jgi:hypothetical protein
VPRSHRVRHAVRQRLTATGIEYKHGGIDAHRGRWRGAHSHTH